MKLRSRRRVITISICCPILCCPMRKAILLYNPLSGRKQNRRLEIIRRVAEILRSGGVELTVAPTIKADESAQQAREAIQQGCDTVIAAGGDGTIHDIVQGLVGKPTALGVIPLGTANALAHDLGMPLSAERAAHFVLTTAPQRIAVGRIAFQTFAGARSSCYFIVAAGIGADAHLFHSLDPTFKLRFGMLAYYAQASWVWLTLPLTRFLAEYTGADGALEQADLSELLAVRIRKFGGVLREFAPGASLARPDLRLVLFKTSSRWRYLHYVLRRLAGSREPVNGIEWAHSSWISCRAHDGQKAPVYVEADGEILGTLPVEIEMMPDAVTLLCSKPPW
jgi:diacylglycerol kinase (ATP)